MHSSQKSTTAPNDVLIQSRAGEVCLLKGQREMLPVEVPFPDV